MANQLRRKVIDNVKRHVWIQEEIKVNRPYRMQMHRMLSTEQRVSQGPLGVEESGGVEITLEINRESRREIGVILVL